VISRTADSIKTTETKGRLSETTNYIIILSLYKNAVFVPELIYTTSYIDF